MELRVLDLCRREYALIHTASLDLYRAPARVMANVTLAVCAQQAVGPLYRSSYLHLNCISNEDLESKQQSVVRRAACSGWGETDHRSHYWRVAS